jgi:thiamine pyrophosphokinase
MPGRRVAIVFVGGDPVPRSVAGRLPGDALVIAADSGLDHAVLLGRPVDLVVGDLDSASKSGLAQAKKDGARIQKHDADKDQTDLELALDAAVAEGAEHIAVIGGYGGRVDHFLDNALLLSSPAYDSVVVDGLMGLARLHVVRGERTMPARPGELCSLLPMHGTAAGVRTAGLKWALNDEPLPAGTSRGVSNVVEDDWVTVAVRDGVLIALFPGESAPTAS